MSTLSKYLNKILTNTAIFLGTMGPLIGEGERSELPESIAVLTEVMSVTEGQVDSDEYIMLLRS